MGVCALLGAGDGPATSGLHAVEAALRLRDASVGPVEVVVLGLGSEALTRPLVRALALGADRCVRVSLDAADRLPVPARAIALAAALDPERADLTLLAGADAASAAALAAGIGELLGAPVLAGVEALAPTAEGIRTRRVASASSDHLELPLPAVVALSANAFEPRFPSLLGAQAEGPSTASLPAAALERVDAAADRVRALGTRPAPARAPGREVDGTDPRAAAAEVARALERWGLVP